MTTAPLALSPALSSELLTYVLTHQTYPTTVIICQRRGDFFDSLLRCIPQHVQAQPPPPPEDNDTEGAPAPITELRSRHHLLIPTLHQIATSRHINLIYIPSVSHLRAYLAVFPSPPSKDPPPEQKFDKPGKKPPLLVVYGLLELHRDTSEWSAQGVGSSLAGLVEAGWRCRRRIVLMEERKGAECDLEVRRNLANGEGEEGEGEGRETRRTKMWVEKVPMLTGNVKRAAFETEDGGWSGRTIEVGRILARWFRFERSDWDDQV